MTATHSLEGGAESQGEASAVDQNYSKASQPLTLWRAKDNHNQQARVAAKHHSHSLSGDPRAIVLSRLDL